jgi:hypothetical protein
MRLISARQLQKVLAKRCRRRADEVNIGGCSHMRHIVYVSQAARAVCQGYVGAGSQLILLQALLLV